jgi:hypothetical protein
LNLDVNATLLSAIRSHGLKVPLEIDFSKGVRSLHHIPVVQAPD